MAPRLRQHAPQLLLGTSIGFILTSLAVGVGTVLLLGLEILTDHWFINARASTSWRSAVAIPVQAFATMFVLSMLSLYTGAFFGTIYRALGTVWTSVAAVGLGSARCAPAPPSLEVGRHRTPSGGLGSVVLRGLGLVTAALMAAASWRRQPLGHHLRSRSSVPSDPDPVLVPTRDMDDNACAVCSNRVGWCLAWSTTWADGLIPAECRVGGQDPTTRHSPPHWAVCRPLTAPHPSPAPISGICEALPEVTWVRSESRHGTWAGRVIRGESFARGHVRRDTARRECREHGPDDRGRRHGDEQRPRRDQQPEAAPLRTVSTRHGGQHEGPLPYAACGLRW